MIEITKLVVEFHRKSWPYLGLHGLLNLSHGKPALLYFSKHLGLQCTQLLLQRVLNLKWAGFSVTWFSCLDSKLEDVKFGSCWFRSPHVCGKKEGETAHSICFSLHGDPGAHHQEEASRCHGLERKFPCRLARGLP